MLLDGLIKWCLADRAIHLAEHNVEPAVEERLYCGVAEFACLHAIHAGGSAPALDVPEHGHACVVVIKPCLDLLSDGKCAACLVALGDDDDARRLLAAPPRLQGGDQGIDVGLGLWDQDRLGSTRNP